MTVTSEKAPRVHGPLKNDGVVNECLFLSFFIVITPLPCIMAMALSSFTAEK